MRARRRIFIVTLCVLIFIAAVIAAVLLRKRAAPEAARLLPEADAVIYIDFATVRNLTSFDQQPLPALAPGYEEFVKNTGFNFERDLDEAAMAVHRGTLNGATRTPTRYTEILSGHYDQMKLAQYLRQHSRSVESYRDVDVYSVPIENRTLRVALLAIDTVAISNVDDAAIIHGIIDRFKKVALPFGGPRLVRTYFPKVPLGSLLWAIASIPPSTTGQHPAPGFTLPGGLEIGLPGNSDVVVSLRLLTTIHARVEFYTPSEQSAHKFTEQTNAFLNIFRGIEANAQAKTNTQAGAKPKPTPPDADADLKTVFDSLSITQKGDEVEVLATIPPTFLRKLVNEPARNAVPGVPAPVAPVAPIKK